MSAERRVEVTSSAWLHRPEQFFYVIGQVNKERTPQRRIGVELYPVHYLMGAPLGPGRITAEKIESWQMEHGQTPIERIHLPFHWNLPSALDNFFWHSLFPGAKPYEPGSKKDRLIAMAVSWATVTVQNGFATELAGETRAGLNVHRNIGEAAGKNNKISELRGDSKYVWIENDLDYPRVRPEQITIEKDSRLACDVIEKYGYDGLILGIDHTYRLSLNPRRDFEGLEQQFDKHLRVLHLSGSRGDHGLITADDHEFWDFMYFAKARVGEDVRFCLDLNPLQMRKMSPDQQVTYMGDLIGELEKF